MNGKFKLCGAWRESVGGGGGGEGKQASPRSNTDISHQIDTKLGNIKLWYKNFSN